MPVNNRYFSIFYVTLMLTGTAIAQTTRDQISITGGFTPEPLQRKVGEELVKQFPNFKPPLIQPNSAGLGFKAFCVGTGLATPDITGGVRTIRPAERELCEKNGVNEIVEFKVGFDALVAAQAQAGRLRELTRKELFLAMAKDVPDPKDNTKLISNPYKSWKDINPALPDSKIQIIAPDTLLGFYQSHIDNIMKEGCRRIDSLKALESSDAKAFETVCTNFRKDGLYTESKDLNASLQETKNNPDIVNIVTFSRALKADLKLITLDGMEPTLLTVSRQNYGLILPIFLYVKKAHVALVPGLKEYLAEFTSEKAVGTTGYFYDLGVVPMPLTDRQKMREDVKSLRTLPN